MAQFYADENFPLPVVEQLRELGHDVLTTSESGKAEQKIPDEEILAFATENSRILLTLNRKHFIRLHTERPHHAGIFVCTFDSDFVGQAQRIHLVTIEQSNIEGELIRVNRPLQ
jgi:predicted nuclease of predicted toxin-antitoxin system